MRDYYKILGVEEEASEEEIRARWIELTKYYHPDLGGTEEGDERIKEINEAYEILKDEATRFHYDFERDLKRSFIKKAHRQQERRTNIRKIIIVPSGILVLFLIVGFILFRRGEVATLPKTEALYKVDKVPEKKTVPQIPPVKTDSKPREESKAPKEIKEEIVPPESQKMVSLSPRLSPSSVERESEREKEPPRKILPESKVKPAPQVVMKSETPATKEVSKEVPEGGSETDHQGSSKGSPEGDSETGHPGSSKGGPERGRQGNSKGSAQRGSKGGPERGRQGNSKGSPEGDSETGCQGNSERSPEGGCKGSPQRGSERTPERGSQGNPEGGSKGRRQGGSQGGPEGGCQSDPPSWGKFDHVDERGKSRFLPAFSPCQRGRGEAVLFQLCRSI